MVEEATGVSMYENKKKSTRALIEKKDAALKNIDSLINETIIPKLDQLKKEQSSLLEFQKVNAELEHLTKVQVLSTYKIEKENCNKATHKIDEINSNKNDLTKRIDSSNEKTEDLSKEIACLEKQKDQEFGGKLAQLENDLREKEKEETNLSNNLQNQYDELKETEKKISQVNKNLQGDKKICLNKQKELQNLKCSYENLEQNKESAETALKKAQDNFEAISAGKSIAADGQAATLAEQLMQAKNQLSNLNTETQKVQMDMKFHKTELKKKESEVNRQQTEYLKEVNEIETRNKIVDDLKKKLDKMQFDEEKYKQTKDKRKQLEHQRRQLDHEISQLESKVPNSILNYPDPKPGFDRKKVLGVVCNLFKVKDERYYYAVEKAVGGKLYQIVVDTDETAKQIKDCMNRRTTFIIMDKLQRHHFDETALKNAKRLVGGDKVFAVKDLVEFDPKLKNVMDSIFSDTFICADVNDAKKVAFTENIKKKAVTADGDVYEPSGTLAGGSNDNRIQVLEIIQEIQQKKNQLNQLNSDLKKVEEELKKMDSHSQQYFQVKNDYNIKSREAELVNQRLQEGNQHRIIKEIDELKAKIQECENILIQNKNLIKEKEKSVKELEANLKNSKSIREREEKQANENMKTAKKNYESLIKKFDEYKQVSRNLELEIADLEKAAVEYEKQLEDLNNEKIRIQKEISELEEEVKKINQIIAKLSENVKKQRKILKNHSDEIIKKQKEKENINKLVMDYTLQIKQLDYEISNVENSSKDAKKNLNNLTKKFPWLIHDENQLAEYELSNLNLTATDLKRRLEKLNATKNALLKTVNMRANTMLSDKEKESDELNKKRKIIANDRNKLFNYMDEVDSKKKDELNNAWETINKDFGEIFGTFLPSSNAKLVASEGKTIFDGLEVKVAFGQIWKDSLSELSGGQRSLVALSLILALLKYNPAPLYILDEVDAALDQSHTTNTGIMIRNHFKNSQVNQL